MTMINQTARIPRTAISLAMAISLLCACSNGNVNESADAAAGSESEVAPSPQVKNSGGTTSKVGSPVSVNYRVIGEPVVGQPVAVELQVSSALGSQPLDMTYRVNDSTALNFPEAQPLSVALSPAPGEGDRSIASQQVTVIPMREGRLYLNISVAMETATGSWSSVTAVPIQVGKAPRELIENGTVTTDENGELIRSLPAKED